MSSQRYTPEFIDEAVRQVLNRMHLFRGDAEAGVVGHGDEQA